jgi:dTDP-4-dehydrorhamnose reductase
LTGKAEYDLVSFPYYFLSLRSKTLRDANFVLFLSAYNLPAYYICIMKILVTGANGLLGQYLVALLLQEGYSVVALSRGISKLQHAVGSRFSYYDVDITLELPVTSILLQEQPDVVVHAAAMTQVDECQLNQSGCETINVQATAQLLVAAETTTRHFIYISTDFVFDGEQGNYKEDDHLNPVSWYGFTKVQAESMVETSDMDWAIVRTCLVYGNAPGSGRTNIISWVKQSLEAGKPIKVVNDQWRTPTYAGDLAKGILLIIQQKATGIYHISGKDKMTPYDIAMQTAAYCKLDASLIEKTDAASFTQPARRPPKTGFDITKARTTLGFEPVPFAEGLAAMTDLIT